MRESVRVVEKRFMMKETSIEMKGWFVPSAAQGLTIAFNAR